MSENVGAQSMTVAALVGDTVVMLPPGVTAQDVVEALAAAEIGAVAIGEGGEVSAVVSERDIIHAVAAGRDLPATPALDIASTHLVWCDAQASVSEVATEMAEQYVRHVLVEEDGCLTGIVSARDVLGVYAAVDGTEDRDREEG